MKIIARNSLVLLMVFLSWNSFSSFTGKSKIKSEQYSPANIEELVIQVSRVSDKNYSEYLAGLQSIPGVTVSGYCEDLKCFMLLVDRDVNPTNARIFDKMKSQGTILVKRGSTFEMIKTNCSNYSTLPVTGETKPAQN